MPKFRFVMTGDGNSPQPDLVLLKDLAAAKSQMVMMAGQMLKDIDGAFWVDSDWQIDLQDQAGLILCSIMVHGFEAGATARS